MRHITILVPNGHNNLSSIVGSYKILNRANEYFNSESSTYKIVLAGTNNIVEFYDGLFTVRPHTTISAIKKSHLIIIPSLNHNYEEAIRDNTEIIEWITSQYNNGAEIASVCTGAFLLAETGILDGVSCSTHWAASDNFRLRFPKIKIEPDKLITDENGIYTNGGAYSFLNLIIYLVEKYFNRETAIYCSKVFQIEMDRQSQSEFIIFKGQKQHTDEVVREAQIYIEANMNTKISFEKLSEQLSVGRRNFDRRFIKATGNTPLEYMQRVRVETAKKAFETTQLNVIEVMYSVGYSDIKAFREVFRKVTGISPLEYKTKYKKGKLAAG